MNEDFRASIRLAIKRFEAQGITCRQRTPEELKAYNETTTIEEQPKLLQVPFKERVKQVKQVRIIAKREKLLIEDACEVVGISFSNYRSVKAAMKKGLSKRP